jgi:hypothetical protein
VLFCIIIITTIGIIQNITGYITITDITLNRQKVQDLIDRTDRTDTSQMVTNTETVMGITETLDPVVDQVPYTEDITVVDITKTEEDRLHRQEEDKQ